MERLSEKHKELVRTLVKAVRDGQVDEVFTVSLYRRGEGKLSREGDDDLEISNLSGFNLDLLAEEDMLFQRTSSTSSKGKELARTVYITPKGFRAVDSDFNPTPDVLVGRPPIEISESLARFRQDFPDPNKLAFVMMQFGSSTAHNRILAGIRNALEPHGMTSLRADDKEYHDDLYFNILTYIYGVRFGIAVFERIDQDDFNPNVSLEVGYMLGLRKSVCFLKDRTLSTLQTDLVGKLYRTFDPHDPETTIPRELFDWMDGKGFIVRSES